MSAVRLLDASSGADFSDQTGIFNPANFAETLTVIGCGGIGGSILPTLVTMGFSRYVLYDDDVVEERNMASTLIYTEKDKGRPKVDVVSEYLLSHGAQDVVTFKRKFESDDEVDGVVISGVDTMAARSEIWEAFRTSMSPLYLDGRIGGEQFTLLIVEPFDGEWYEKRWLFDDSKLLPLPCAQRAIVYPAAALGATMGSVLARWSRNEQLPRRITQHMGSFFYQVVN